MGNYTILWMFENPRSGRQARNFTTNAPKILDLKSSSEQIFSRKFPLGAPGSCQRDRASFCTGQFFLKLVLNFILRAEVSFQHGF